MTGTPQPARPWNVYQFLHGLDDVEPEEVDAPQLATNELVMSHALYMWQVTPEAIRYAMAKGWAKCVVYHHWGGFDMTYLRITRTGKNYLNTYRPTDDEIPAEVKEMLRNPIRMSAREAGEGDAKAQAKRTRKTQLKMFEEGDK